MFECCDIPTHLCQLPTELIIYIFKLLPAKYLIACRQVCKRWKNIVDDVSSNENMWEEHCKRDFKTLYKDAKIKSNSCRLWFDVYRSLTLWGRLQDATEVRDEFCHSSTSADEIKDLCILKNGVVLIHKYASVVYFDISTLEAAERSPLVGEFTKYFEYGDASVILGNHLHLHIVRKVKPDPFSKSENQNEESIFRHTRLVLLFGKYVYFIHFSNTIFYCNLEEELKATKLSGLNDETAITLSLYNGILHVLTIERNIYSYKNNTYVHLFDLESKKSNLFDFLWRYQFIENIDWLIFYIWVTNLRITLPEGPLRYISRVKVYGDIFFIGCKNGVVQIYYKPYTDGQLDFYTHKPIKQYRFAERQDIPVLSLNPILKIEISEIKEGHRVLIAMPKKVIVLTFTHNFQIVKSKAVVPYVTPDPVVFF